MSINESELADAYHAGLAAESAGNPQLAAKHYSVCLMLDPADRCGASIRLASMGMAEAPAKAPDSYIATLFDQHADQFDDILTGQLGYAVPMQLAAWLSAHCPGPYERMLDIGCGTGLTGMMLLELCTHSTGVDLSEKIIELADERAAYDALFVNEAVHFLDEYAASDDPEHQPFDLIVATDVLPYFGVLDRLIAGIAKNARAGTVLALSSETLIDHDFGAAGWSITAQQRYAHDPAYLLQMCSQSGFKEKLLIQDIVVRTDNGVPLPGHLLVMRCPHD